MLVIASACPILVPMVSTSWTQLSCSARCFCAAPEAAGFLPIPSPEHSLLHSPSVGFLQPPGSEQYQMPQSPSPCSPPQMQQQYSGKRGPWSGLAATVHSLGQVL